MSSNEQDFNEFPPPFDQMHLSGYDDEPLAQVVPIMGHGKSKFSGHGMPKAPRRSFTSGDPSEDGIALAFAEQFKDKARYCHTRGCWYTNAGPSWRRDDSMLAFSWARDLCRDLNVAG